jgi:hypothetical protein
MKTLSLILTLFLLFSCGKKKGELILFEKTESDYSQFINSGSKPAQPNMTTVKRIVNNDYPVEIALFEDGKFHYYLENLGEGEGTWRYENGVIKLSALRKILSFDVNMDYTFTITRKDGSQSVLKFRDRFGNQAYSTKLLE